jgi:hypothetical protein
MGLRGKNRAVWLLATATQKVAGACPKRRNQAQLDVILPRITRRYKTAQDNPVASLSSLIYVAFIISSGLF